MVAAWQHEGCLRHGGMAAQLVMGRSPPPGCLQLRRAAPPIPVQVRLRHCGLWPGGLLLGSLGGGGQRGGGAEAAARPRHVVHGLGRMGSRRGEFRPTPASSVLSPAAMPRPPHRCIPAGPVRQPAGGGLRLPGSHQVLRCRCEVEYCRLVISTFRAAQRCAAWHTSPAAPLARPLTRRAAPLLLLRLPQW